MRLSEAFNRFLVTNLINSIMHSKYQIFIIICHFNYFKIAFLKVKTLRLCLIYTLGVLDSAVWCAPCNVPESSDVLVWCDVL